MVRSATRGGTSAGGIRCEAATRRRRPPSKAPPPGRGQWQCSGPQRTSFTTLSGQRCMAQPDQSYFLSPAPPTSTCTRSCQARWWSKRRQRTAQLRTTPSGGVRGGGGGVPERDPQRRDPGQLLGEGPEFLPPASPAPASPRALLGGRPGTGLLPQFQEPSLRTPEPGGPRSRSGLGRRCRAWPGGL